MDEEKKNSSNSEEEVNNEHIEENNNEEAKEKVDELSNSDVESEVNNETEIDESIESENTESKEDEKSEYNQEYIKTNNEKEETKEEIIEEVIKKPIFKEKIIKPKYIVIGGLSLSILLGSVFAVNSNYNTKLINEYVDKVYPNSMIYNVDVSDMNKSELSNTVKGLEEKIENISLNISCNSKTYNIPLKDLGYNSDSNSIISEIFNYGKDKDKKEKIQLIKSNDINQYKFKIDIQEDKLKEVVEKIANETNVEVVNPTIKIDGDKISIIEGKKGLELDESNLIKTIKSELDNLDLETTNIKIESTYKESNPNYGIDDLKKVDTKISYFRTTHNSGPGRSNNIKVATSKIDDMLLMPGEEFSYEKAIGPVSSSNGYQNAPVIVNGALKDGIGGGVCQVSSTMYNTQLRAGILPTERRNHSKDVGYVPKGLDATLATGAIDYKFKNTYNYPLVINAYATDSEIVVEFWSNKDATKGIVYEPKSYIEGNVANTYLYGYGIDGKEVYKQYIDRSIYK